MWNGFSMISKRAELTEGMMQTLVEAERTLLESPGNVDQSLVKEPVLTVVLTILTLPLPSAENEYTLDDRCLIHMLKGLCFKNQGLLQAAEECFNRVCSRSDPVDRF